MVKYSNLDIDFYQCFFPGLKVCEDHFETLCTYILNFLYAKNSENERLKITQFDLILTHYARKNAPSQVDFNRLTERFKTMYSHLS